VHYLPPSCPELNPIEILWRKIKHDWLPLSCYTCYANLKTAVLEILGALVQNTRILLCDFLPYNLNSKGNWIIVVLTNNVNIF
jgi:transposase